MAGNPIARERKCPRCGSERVERKGTAQGAGWGSEGFHNQWEQYECGECRTPFRLLQNKQCPKCGTTTYVDNPVCSNCGMEVPFIIPE